ncbi:MAG: VWA domain-containing protein [Bradymonadaceae bacterium]
MSTDRRSFSALGFALVSVLLFALGPAGCGDVGDGGGQNNAVSTEPPGGSGGGSDDGSGGDSGGGDSGGGGASDDGDSGGSSAGGDGGEYRSDKGGGTPSESGGDSGGKRAGSSGGGGGSGGGSKGGSKDKDPKPGQLTAGEWRDLDHWSFWIKLFHQQSNSQYKKQLNFGTHESKWALYTRQRFAVRVVTGSDKPVADARVELLDSQGKTVWTARTDNRGRAELYKGFDGNGSSGPFTVEASAGGPAAVKHNVQPTSAGHRLTLNLEHTQPPKPAVDVMFTIDTTGSMSDELEYIQSELSNVVQRTQKRVQQQLSIRTSVNLYRDKGDDYVVRSHPFRRNLSTAVSDIDSEQADGGGDYPEAVHTALDKSINGHEWRKNARARILFLVLDAPAHDKPQVKQVVRDAVRKAAEKGIRIIPVAGSGVNKTTEFLLRAFGIATGGSYVFLTDHSGIGGSHIQPSIGSYEVRYLNNLLVELIARFSEEIVKVGKATP